MGADGDTSAFAWYRASVNVTLRAGKLHFRRQRRQCRRPRQRPARRRVPRGAEHDRGADLAPRPAEAFNYMGALDNYAARACSARWNSTSRAEDGGQGWKMRGGVGRSTATGSRRGDAGVRILPGAFACRPLAGRILRATTQG